MRVLQRLLSISGIFPAVLLASLLLSSCSSNKVQSVVPFKVPISIEAADDINQYGDGRARSVVVRIYQLTEPGPFENAEFLDLFQSDKLLLADSLVDVLYLDPLIPGSQRDITLDVQVQTRYLAVLAEFADYINAQSKSLAALSETPDKYPAYIRLNGQAVTLTVTQPQPKKHWWQK